MADIKDNEYKEYETFEMEIRGEIIELALEEEFEVQGQKYVVASKVVEDTIVENESYIFKIMEIDGDKVIEKICDAKEYEQVTKVYMKLQEEGL